MSIHDYGIGPYLGGLPALHEDPVSAIAQRSSGEAAAVLRGRTRARRVETRLSAIKSISKDNADQACTWLTRRFPGERNMVIDTTGAAGENRCFFAESEKVRVRTSIHIW